MSLFNCYVNTKLRGLCLATLLGVTLFQSGCKTPTKTATKEEFPEIFDFNENEASLSYSIITYRGDCTIERENSPRHGGGEILTFARLPIKVLSLKVHPGSVFREDAGILYFADFRFDNNGGIIIAYDMSIGRTIWTTRLQGIGDTGHSIYSNRITMDISPDKLIVKGNERDGDYIEILDKQSGMCLGHRIYRHREGIKWLPD